MYKVSEWERMELQESRRRKPEARKYVKVTPAMRREILSHPEIPATKMAARLGISPQTVHNVWAASNEAMEDAVEGLDVPRGSIEEEAALAEHGPVEMPAPDGFYGESLVSLINQVPDRHLHSLTHKDHVEPHDDCDQCHPPSAPEAPAAVDVVPAGVPVAEPKPASHNQDALRRVICEEDAPAIGKPPFGSVYHERETEPDTVSITVPLTHERANAIWGGLSLEEKATFCRTKIIERLELMA